MMRIGENDGKIEKHMPEEAQILEKRDTLNLT
jgi:hypothetical protein